MASSFSGEIINFSHLYRYNLLFQILAATALIALNYFLIPILGITGAGLSYLVAILFHLSMKLVFVRLHFKMHPFVNSHLPLLLLGIVIGALALFFKPSFHPIINITIRSILTTILFVAAVYFSNISTDINKVINSTFGRLVNFQNNK